MRLFTILGVVFLVIGIGLAAVPFLPGDDGIWGEFLAEGAGIAALTFIPMGIIFTVIGVYFGRLTAGRKRLLREGIPGQATILSLDGGNLVVNNINYMITFQLRVTVPGRAPYDVSHRQLVPIFSLASLPVGSTVPVMVDPRDPTKLTIDLAGESVALRQGTSPTAAAGQVVPNTLSTMRSTTPNTFTPDLPNPAPGTTTPAWQSGPVLTTPPGVIPGAPALNAAPSAMVSGLGGATLGLVVDQLARAGVSVDPAALAQGALTVGPTMTVDASPTRRAANLLANGRPGTALLREVKDTGVDVHGDSVIEMTLDVTPAGGPAYQVRTATLVPAAVKARALPGATVPVRIDPAQPDSVAIDWQG